MYLDRFHRQSLDERRQQIAAARTKGSVTKEIKVALNKAEASGQLKLITDDITEAANTNGCALLFGRKDQYKCRRVVLATGFNENRPGTGLTSQVIKEFKL